VSAPSGAGKTSLVQALLPRLRAQGIAAVRSVSYTTRPPRAGETDGEHYHFTDAQTFAAMAQRGEFLEHATVFGHRYGTGRGETERLLAAGIEVLLVIDWQGARQVRSHMPQAPSVFVVPPSPAELARRLQSRGQDHPAEIAARLRAARQEIAHYVEYDYLIVNDRFERALDELAAVVVARRLRREAQAVRHAELLRSLLSE
jgi:guanylate kinase